MPLNLNDIIQVTVACQQGAQLGMNVVHYIVDQVQGASQTELQVATNLEAAIGPAMKPLLNNNASFYGVHVQKIKPLPPTIGATSALVSGPGTGGANSLPTEVCGIVTKRTAFAGRTYRGRIYVPFPSQTAVVVATGIPTAAYQTNLTALGAVMLAGRTIGVLPDTVHLNPIVFSKKNGSYASVTTWLARSKWGAQRRRGDYGQANTFPPF